MARGDEILIADAVAPHAAALRKLFEEAGYVCTCVGDAARARSLLERKFFPAAVVDVDLDGTKAGLELVRFIAEHSKPTAVVMLFGKPSFEAAVEALRLGVIDIIDKRPGETARLHSAVSIAVERHRTTHKDGAMLREMRGVLDDGFKIMLSMGRRIYADSGSANSAVSLSIKPTILIVDDDARFLQELAALVGEFGWHVTAEMTGGAALDKASSAAFSIVAAREQLVDLGGPMVIRSVQAQQPRTLGIVYTAPGPQGRIERYEGGRPAQCQRPFHSAKQLVDKLRELVDEIVAMDTERRYIQAFRTEHGDFVRRFAALKLRLDSLMDPT